MARLIDTHGSTASIRGATRDLTAECPNRDGSTYSRCDVHFPELSGWLLPSKPRSE